MTTHEVIQRTNQEVLRRINREVTLRAARFANALLSGVFRAIFRVEKALEFSEPEVFQLDYEPDRILWSRLDEYHLRNLPRAIAGEEVLASRYRLFTEYDFVIVVDVSQSMMLDWWVQYGGKVMEGEIFRALPTQRVGGDRTKLFLLKYALASFLHAARANDFMACALLAGGGTVQEYDSRQERNMEEVLLNYIDRHFRHLVQRTSAEPPKLAEALRRVVARRRRAIVLCITDFRDTLQHIGEDRPSVEMRETLLQLAEIATHHRLLVLQINDDLEMAPQEEHIRVGTRTCPHLNTERFADSHGLNLKARQLVRHRDRVREWNDILQRRLADFGIKSVQVIAGRNDLEIDRKIYELGIATGT
jgi:hypothetical protein